MKVNSSLATSQSPVYPQVKVKLIGGSSDMRAILPKIRKAMKAEGVSESAITQFIEEVFSSECYYSALSVCCRWIKIS